MNGIWKREVYSYLAARLALWLQLLVVLVPTATFHAQDLVPRAYVITPVHSNALTLSYSFSNGSVLFDNTLPIKDAKGQIHIGIASYYHSFSLFGRSANVTASLPYAIGNFEGQVFQQARSVYRSGLLDSYYRFSVNLKGGPAMSPKAFASWKQKTLIGASLKVLVPTGQYDPARLINQGANRWAFKPEVGVSQRWGNWILDGYGAVWFFTDNSEFFPGKNVQSQQPVGAFEMHLGYDVKPRLWVSFDGNYWFGGRTTLRGIQNPRTFQSNSRIGATGSLPISKHQSIKVSYANGAYVVFGGDYQTVSVAWQYSWVGKNFR